MNKKIWGWFFFDWASQPYNTLLLTFIFGPYITEVLGDGTKAQATWGYGVAAAGLLIAVSAPFLGAIADRSGGRMGFIWLFSIFYVVGAAGLWIASPDSLNLFWVMAFFALGLIGMEMATIFTNAMLPDLGTRDEIGKISGSGWAFGYCGGVLSLVVMLTLFAESATTGKTLIGLDPIFGLDAEAREGTRAVGPLTALWYVVFMIPFFLWVREKKRPDALPIGQAVAGAWPALKVSLKRLPSNQSLFAYLGSSMFYRDALNGMYVFGGIYAAGVLGWETVDVGIFGILAAVTGALFAWLGGKADTRYGPKPVITISVAALALISLGVIYISPTSVFGMSVAEGSALPSIAFYAMGAGIGAAGGVLQSASRTMLVRQADPTRITESFGLYALAGKATSFVAPLTIGLTTDITGSQQAGIAPVVVLLLIGLVLLWWVDPEGNRPAAPVAEAAE
ncbi:MAG: MFS transporter [Oceanicola sp.]|nr:MFS transporter [Oceanicola sp.]